MPRYFMHLIDGTDVLLDPDGVEMAIEAVTGTALVQARDCMAGDVRDGCLDLGYHIAVHDEGGAVVHSLAFKDALQIVRSS
ncbi:MAG: DUF6894 family protein [Sphingomicrobium sp.]|jgi:hypothetical protein